MDIEIVDIEAADTRPLRRSVLRDGTAGDSVEFDGDDLATTFHLGARVAGNLVAVSSFMRRAHAEVPDAYQVRGMATDPAHRRHGLGGLTLAAGVERCRGLGATVVWAWARDTALSFYERRGFDVVGEGYVDETTGLPHHDVVRRLG